MDTSSKSAALLVSALALTACGGGDGSAPAPADPAPATPPASAQGNCPAVGNLVPTEVGDAQCEVGGVLTADASLTSGFTWFLNGRLQVGNATDAATLTVDAGTQVRGNDADHLLVMPGSELRALGTAASPVQFLSDDDGVDGKGEWGGVFLRGFNGLPTLTGTQGANVLDYVVVAEAGAPVEVTVDGVTTTYQDNIVVNGVDRESTFTFVQSHNSARDGVHILNGDPRMSWILVTGAERDGIWYRDFSGLIKDLMVIHDRDGDGTSGRAGIYASETMDGESNPRIVNVTLVGRDDSSEAAADDGNEFGILFADNTDQIRLGNVLVANFRNGCFEADSGADLSMIDTNVPGPTYLDGVHCANEAGPNPMNFGVVRDDSIGFPDGTVAANNSINANGLVY